MPLVDVHAHFHEPNFTNDEVYSLLNENQHLSVVNVVENLKDFQASTQIKHERYFYSIGLHPEYVSKTNAEILDQEFLSIKEILNSNQSIVSLGEVGLDFRLIYQNHKEKQWQYFNQFIELGKALDLPLNIHSRQAGHYAIDKVIQSKVRVNFHAFDGKWKYVQKALHYPNIYFSIPCSLQREEHFKKMAQLLPLDRMLLESDSPALPAEIGKKNAPDQIKSTVSLLSRLRGLSEEEIETATTKNAQYLFPKIYLK